MRAIPKATTLILPSKNTRGGVLQDAQWPKIKPIRSTKIG